MTAHALDAADVKLLDGIAAQVMAPRGAKFVRALRVERDAWTMERGVEVTGWRLPDSRGIALDDGNVVFATVIGETDFVADCTRFLAATRTPSLGGLVRAAWLHRLGHDKEASLMLAGQRRLGALASWKAPQHKDFLDAVHAYMVRADDEASFYAARFLREPPAKTRNDDRQRGQIAAIVAELERRKSAGSFGRKPPAVPKNPTATWLVAQLDEVDARQSGQPGGVSLGQDPRVAALIAIGEPAVPELLDCLEHDERLTRSVHFWRDFVPDRTVLAVREAALTALMTILRVRVFEPAATGDNFTSRGDGGQMAKRLRAYWARWGKLDFAARMMGVLTDPASSSEQLREAAHNLAAPEDRSAIGTTVFQFGPPSDAVPKPNPAIARFSSPTAAEAIVAALDRDLAALAKKPRDSMSDYYRHQGERAYLGALVDLGDTRIASVLERRSTTSTGESRRIFAAAAFDLGAKTPLAKLADDLREGRAGDGTTEELGALISSLSSAATPEADRALDALADAKHPRHAAVVEALFKHNTDDYEAAPWYGHRYVLRILGAALDDKTPIGVTMSLGDDGRLATQGDSWSSWSDKPGILLRAPHVKKVALRRCDMAAVRIDSLVAGEPEFHPLLTDAAARLAAMRTFLDENRAKLRAATPAERVILKPGFVYTAIFLARPRARASGKLAGSDDRVLIFDGPDNAHAEILGMHFTRTIPRTQLFDTKSLP